MTRASAQPDVAFVRHLRRALRHLYDPDELRRSPLRILLPEGERDSPAALQRLLAGSIEALRPAATVSSQSAAYRSYHTLSGRYLQQFSQSEVAQSLGVSLRQMRRQDNLALRSLAESLWQSHRLQEQPATLWTAAAPTLEGAPAPTREQELQWLERSEARELVSLPELIAGLVRTAEPLARSAGVALETHVPADLPGVVVPAGVLRQALLSLLSAAVHQAAGADVCLAVEAGAGQVRIRVSPASAADGEELLMARQLADLIQGSLVSAQGALELALPHALQTPILVIDDNADALQLMQRYLSGTPYGFACARDPDQGLALAARLRPGAVILDIMLPGIDGWELLGRLRAHPALLGVPIIVSTILPQEKLAMSLGAAAFLRKPVSREVLMETLDQLCGTAN